MRCAVAGRRTGRERGQTSLLIVGFAVVLAMLVAVVVDASSAYLRRQGLNSLADGAALAAADGVQGEQVYTSGLREGAVIDPHSAERYVAEYLDALGAHRKYPGLAHRVDSTGDRVVVRLSAPLDLPFVLPGVGRRPVITGTAASFVLLSD